MAGVLGGLVVSLALNVAEFTTGLTKAELEARKFSESLERGMAQAGRLAAVGIAAIGTAAVAAAVAVDRLSKEAAQFQDLSEKTGASASSLASFAVAAKVAGTSMESIAGASIKLTKNLTGVDDESKAAGAALAALGINIQQFKALSPDKQIDAIAKALSRFEEGAGKTAVAIALFGKAGADSLPFLKELGEGIGRVNILTDEQIKRADAYSDAQARTRAQLGLYAQALATEALFALTAFTGAVTDAIKAMLGMNEQAGKLPTNEVRAFAEGAARALADVVDVGQAIVTVFQVISEVSKRSKLLDLFGAEDARKSIKTLGSDIDALLQKPQFSQLLEQRLAAQRAAERAASFGPPEPKKPTLNFAGAQTGSRAGAERISEAQRFLDSLKQQLDRTLELTTVEQVLKEIQTGRLKGASAGIQSQSLGIAAEIDARKELNKFIEESRKAFDEERKAIEANEQQRARFADAAINESQRAHDNNEALRDEIAIILGGDFARKALEKDHLANAIAAKEMFLVERQLAGALDSELGAIKSNIEALKERAKLLQGRDVAEQLKKDAEQLQQFKNIFADTFADAFSSFIDGSKSASDAFKSFAKSVEQQITRLAAQNIADKIFGGNSGGGGFDFSKIIASLFGGLGGAGGGAFGGAGGGGGFGTLAGGTPSWRGGLTVVGERGPEVVNLPRGASVTSNRDSQKLFGPTINFSINVLPGASTQTAAQAAAQTGIAVRRAMARNT